MEQKRTHRGRPPVTAKPGEKTTVSLRLTAEMKGHLDTASKASGRPLSQEAELRLEQSLRSELLLNQVLSLKYGRQLAGLLRMIGDAMVEVGPQAAFESTKTLDGAKNWIAEASGAAAAKSAAVHIIDTVAPHLSQADEKKADAKGRAYAKSIIQSVMGRGGNEYTKRDEAEIKALLGPLAQNLKVN